jgi:hypothetical protein
VADTVDDREKDGEGDGEGDGAPEVEADAEPDANGRVRQRVDDSLVLGDAVGHAHDNPLGGRVGVQHAVDFGHKLDDVHVMGHMIESHVNRLREWPEVDEDENMRIFVGNQLPLEDELKMLSVIEWSMDELKLLCASSYLDLLHVENLRKTDAGYGISGNRYIFEGNQLFYTTILNQLYEKE